MSIRTEKVASVIKKTLAVPINELGREIAKGAMISITHIVMTKDLSIAKVYLSIFGGKQSPLEVVHSLEDNAGTLRSEVASKVHLKSVPELRFFLDDTLDQMEQIQKLIDKTNSQPKKEKYNSEDYK
jgi:ribosome-binding factor A